ncbi:hypothetical protein FB470_002687 [Amycolatopsis thermophila]|uniref:Transposase DDE domain-containing protein n=1 Tax=Amycolatopsis thermophila TaxID=206084 RepID=A0ABU0ETQ9_9PSEU|nr:hypothetical protein [Amycolatopsis thermophila]
MSLLLTGGNVNDCAMFTQVMAGIEVRWPGPRRPPTRPSRVLADKAATSYRSTIDLATLLIWL